MTVFVVAGMGVQSLAVLIGSFLLLGFVDNLVDPIGQSLVSTSTPSRHRAAVLSILSFGSSLLMALLAPIFGLVADSAGLSATVLVGGTAAIAIAALTVAVASPAPPSSGASAAPAPARAPAIAPAYAAPVRGE